MAPSTHCCSHLERIAFPRSVLIGGWPVGSLTWPPPSSVYILLFSLSLFLSISLSRFFSPSLFLSLCLPLSFSLTFTFFLSLSLCVPYRFLFLSLLLSLFLSVSASLYPLSRLPFSLVCFLSPFLFVLCVRYRFSFTFSCFYLILSLPLWVS